MKPLAIIHSIVAVLLWGTGVAMAAPAAEQPWTDPETALREDQDFGIQGEYLGTAAGAQVVALGRGRFECHLLENGLPGAGWEPGKPRRLLKGERSGNVVTLKDDAGSAPITTPLASPDGPVFLQHHNDPVVFRNIWILPGI